MNAIYRNVPEMGGVVVGLPLPDWIERDSRFKPEILDQTGTSASRRGVAPEDFRWITQRYLKHFDFEFGKLA